LKLVEQFADTGFRTLFFASRDIQVETFESWQNQFRAANTSLIHRQEKVAKVFSLLESNLVEDGASAIEDLLQENVAETISDLRKAGIKFWMLTGDKYTTALQIALTCKMRTGPTGKTANLLCSIDGTNSDLIGERIQKETLVIEKARKDDPNVEVTVIIRGPTLKNALLSHSGLLVELCRKVDLVIACRVSPQQKGDLVKLVKDKIGGMTLAVGDGGNDVCMIQEANIGIGIRGKEGLQAARASDFSVPNFQVLKELILVHGHYSYIRSAKVIQYSFYKSAFFCFLQIFYAGSTLFAGSPLFDTLCVTAYNMVLFFPTLSFILDQDVAKSALLKYPKLYLDGAENTILNWYTFGRWMLRGAVQAALLTVVIQYSSGSHIDSDGKDIGSDYSTYGLSAFFAYIWIQALTILMTLQNIPCKVFFGIIVLVMLFYVGVIIFSFINSGFFQGWTEYKGGLHLMADIYGWLVTLLGTVLCFAPVFAWSFWASNYRPTPQDHVRYVTKYGDTDRSQITNGPEMVALVPPMPVKNNLTTG